MSQHPPIHSQPQQAQQEPVLPWSQIGLQLLNQTGWPLFRMLCFGLIVSFIYLFGNAMRYHIYSPDNPWMFTAGDYILHHHALPRHDIISWTHPHKPWVLYQWLFEVVITAGKHFFGLNHWLKINAVFLFELYVIWPVWYQRQQGIPFLFSAFVATAAAFLASVNLGLRPMVITSLFLVLQYMFIKQLRAGQISLKRVCLWLIPAYVLWANMHMGLSLGLISLGIMALGDLIARYLPYRYEPLADPLAGEPLPVKPYAIILGLCSVASLINPYGLGLWTYLLNLSGNESLNNAITELSSPDFHLNYYWILFFAIAGFILLLRQARHCFSLQDILLFTAFLFGTLYSQRFVVWLALYITLIFPNALRNAWLFTGKRYPAVLNNITAFQKFELLLITLTGIAILGYLFVPRHLLVMERGSCEALMPAIHAYYRIQKPNDRLFVPSELGSCLLAEHPKMHVFDDTRFDFYNSRFSKQVNDTAALAPHVWKKFLQVWQINTVLIPKDSALAAYLEQNKNTKQLYQNKTAVIYKIHS